MSEANATPATRLCRVAHKPNAEAETLDSQPMRARSASPERERSEAKDKQSPERKAKRARENTVPGEGVEPSRPAWGQLILSQPRISSFATPARAG
jgi:hypothetical protein